MGAAEVKAACTQDSGCVSRGVDLLQSCVQLQKLIGVDATTGKAALSFCDTAEVLKAA